MKTKSISQTVTFDASAQEVYDLIMHSKQHSTFTGSKVKMSKKPKAKSGVFDGYCAWVQH